MPKKRGTEIQMARGRLKGALQELAHFSDEETNMDDTLRKAAVMPTRGRPPKRIKLSEKDQLLSAVASSKQHNVSSTTTAHQSYIMKLFDRSLDLSKYIESTGLYPICRAWMINQPRSDEVQSLRGNRSPTPEARVDNSDLLEKFINGKITDIKALPAPLPPLKLSRAPSPLAEQRCTSKDNEFLNYDLEKPKLSKEDLIANHKMRWTNVRCKWIEHSNKRHSRYAKSFELLENLFTQ